MKIHQESKSIDIGIWSYFFTNSDDSIVVKLNTERFDGPILHVTIHNAPVLYIKGIAITSFHHMFDKCTNLRCIIFDDIPLLKQITNTRCMFSNCTNLERVCFPFNPFPRLIECSYMFSHCYALTEVIAPMILHEYDIKTNTFKPNVEVIKTNEKICQDSYRLLNTKMPYGLALSRILTR